MPHELEYAINRMSNGEKPSRVILITLDDEEPPAPIYRQAATTGQISNGTGIGYPTVAGK